jgi:hypothetical protein
MHGLYLNNPTYTGRQSITEQWVIMGDLIRLLSVLRVHTGDIDVKITGPGKADIVSKEQKDGFVRFVYLPLSPGEYDISIKNKGRNIHGSPFNAKISGKFIELVTVVGLDS